MEHLRNAFHEVWIANGHGHEMEWEHHWRCANNMKKSNPMLYSRTVYPKIMWEARIRRVRNLFKAWWQK